MTTYAHHWSATSIVGTWPTGAGSVAHRVTRVPSTCDGARARHLAQALDRLSEHLWYAYTTPGTDDPDAARLVSILRAPNMPVGDMLRIAEDRRDEAAHTVGRLLAEIDDRGCREAVVREVEAECLAIRSAIAGDLTGRAQQAVTRLRHDVLACQSATAHALLHAVPMGSESLFTDVEPLAASVAALEWLGAAVLLTAQFDRDASAVDLLNHAQLVTERDLRIAIALLDHPVANAEGAVRDLLQEALLAAARYFVGSADEHLDEEGETDGYGSRHDREISTVLDPLEPGRSLLEGIITGIQSLFEVYLDEITVRERPDPDPRLTGPHWAEEVRQRFDAELRDIVQTARL
ncbi:hypothetical protein EV383_4075 [Pseudonocardia sediminis]|uniref:Uncharacterized protein n=1 Tax=Pseudonocardia sediminis TaxID=1397368 RepID=A0A4Q7UYY5_PSEST|nr:hypothetical protein [Pseudonocardia sediminis]RZT87166.1 hypothetical protein EV383_4075 [Pseudonocardia sediminis]